LKLSTESSSNDGMVFHTGSATAGGCQNGQAHSSPFERAADSFVHSRLQTQHMSTHGVVSHEVLSVQILKPYLSVVTIADSRTRPSFRWRTRTVVMFQPTTNQVGRPRIKNRPLRCAGHNGPILGTLMVKDAPLDAHGLRSEEGKS